MRVIFDCNYVCYVSAFALSQGMSYKGNQTEIIYGFLRQLFVICEKFEPDQIIFCWDSRNNKRKEICVNYKSNRKKTDDDSHKEKEMMFSQFEELKNKVLPMLGFQNIFCEDGYESDDLIAQFVKGCNPIETVVISSDNDLLQLLDHCCLYSITKHQITNRRVFTTDYGIDPEDWKHIKAIAGCSSDNVIGVPGVGEKTAIKYWKDSLKGNKKELIDNAKDKIDFNLKLVSLPLEGTPVLTMKKEKMNPAGLMAVCDKYGFVSFKTDKYKNQWKKIISQLK